MSVPFPAPIGSVPFEEDFSPSIVFACAFAIIACIGLFRFSKKATRTLVVLGPLSFAIERVAVWALRAKQARNPSQDMNRNLTICWQITFAAAYMTICGCLTNCLRCVLVATTKSGDTVHHTTTSVSLNQDASEPASQDPEAYTTEGNYVSSIKADKPHARFRYWGIFGALLFATWIPMIMGIIAGYSYVKAMDDEEQVQGVQLLRYITTIIALGLIIQPHIALVYALVAVRGVNRRAVFTLFWIKRILLILPIYEFVVIGSWTSSLTSRAPGSQNSRGEKIACCVLGAAPESIIASILLSLDVRHMFGTGLLGDRFRDPKGARQ